MARAGRRLLLFMIAAGVSGCETHVHLGAVGDAAAAILWSSGFETGSLSDWTADAQGGTYEENISIVPVVSTTVAHNGKYALQATVLPQDGMWSVDYVFRAQATPAVAYYSAWFYLPETYTVPNWLNIIHFRGSHTGDGKNEFQAWDVDLQTQPDGTMSTHVWDFFRQRAVAETTPVPVPSGKWVQFEVLLRKATDDTGRFAVWQDGALIVDIENAQTAENDWAQWNVGASSDEIAPSPALIYIDDAAISLVRLGPGI